MLSSLFTALNASTHGFFFVSNTAQYAIPASFVRLSNNYGITGATSSEGAIAVKSMGFKSVLYICTDVGGDAW